MYVGYLERSKSSSSTYEATPSAIRSGAKSEKIPAKVGFDRMVIKEMLLFKAKVSRTA